MAKLDYSKGRLSGRINRQERDAKAKVRYKLRQKPVTSAQLRLMSKLNITVPEKCTIEKARYLIGQILNKN